MSESTDHSAPWLTPLRAALRDARARACLVGLHGSTPALALALLAQEDRQESGAPRDWVVLTPTDESAERLFNDLRFFQELMGLPVEAVAWFPEWETLPYEATAPHVGLIARRMATLHRLRTAPPRFLVTSVAAAMHRLMPLKTFEQAVLRFQTGADFEREPLISGLLRLGYRRVSVVEIPGEFSLRGGIMDIFSTAYADPLRVEFLGDTVESVRLFDVSTQTSIKKMAEGWVFPAREFLRPPEAAEAASMIPPDAEWRAPDVYPEMDTLFDYLTAAPCLALDQPAVLKETSARAWERIDDGYLRHVDRNAATPYPSPERLFMTWDQLQEKARTYPMLALEPLTAPDATWAPIVPFSGQTPASVGLGTRGTPFAQTLGILERLREEQRVVLVARSRGQVERLLALLREHDLPADEWRPSAWSRRSGGKQPLYVVHGDLSAGFLSSDLRLALLTEEELFAKGARHKPPAKSKTATFLSSLEDLNVGDYVVHVQHGIAKYRGLKRLAVQDFESDFLILEFAGGDTLYVPLDRLNQVQRYSGAESHVPRLDRLGGTSWAKTTARVKKDIEEMAQELIELYANRELVKRNSYGAASTLYHEFEAAFEYEETPDQLNAIHDIVRDMESAKPMDRLVCGDVGYGKTEVAMRATMRAVEAGRQVAVLCPTTVLAFQHLQTFRERFAGLPVRIDMLSRFRTGAEEREILEGLREGKLDVVVGTTRLLGRGVRFRDLGLIVVDEEHRFGVKQKERLKKLRAEVDVLSMSATPIPRTLQMGLSGMREMSVMATPPRDRLSVRTTLVPFSGFAESTIDQVNSGRGHARVREAIHHELERKGQVFFVHNRVEDIEEIAAHLHELVPEAKFAVAHGQMEAEQLEDVLIDFIDKRTDVLVSSAIIESGVDLPNVNTMIVNRADRFGLAQLYQLRGRVGRGSARANCLLLVPEEMTSDAKRRVRTLVENADLGAGFRIAMADLEMRGAGNLLGDAQSGNIDAVGYETWLELLEEAVHEARGDLDRQRLDPEIEVPVKAFLPESFFPDVQERLQRYRALSTAVTEGEVDDWVSEMEARFGDLPPEVVNLAGLARTKILCRDLGIQRCNWLKVRAVLELHPRTRIREERLRGLVTASPKRWALGEKAGVRQLEVRFLPQEAEHPFRFLRWVLAQLAQRE